MRLRSFLDSLNTQSRLLALLLFVCVPLAALLVYAAMDRYRLLETQEEQQVLQMAQMAAATQSEVIMHTRELLGALATDKDIRHRDWAQCNKSLPEFFEHFKNSYTAFHVADTAGHIVCSSSARSFAVNIADRQDFKDALSTRRFVAGDLSISRSSGLLGMMMRYPVIEDGHRVSAVITAQVSVDQFDRASSYLDLPDRGELIMTDRTDEIIMHQPAGATWIGRHLPDGPLLRAMHARQEGVLEAVGADGVKRIYGFAQIDNAESREMHVAIGFPVALIKGAITSNLYQNILILLLLMVLILGLAWLAVDALVLKNVKTLIYTLDNVRGRKNAATIPATANENGETLKARAMDEAAAEIEHTLNLLREDSIRDPLTSLYNRRYLAELLSREIILARRQGTTLAVISADIDHFKRINDTLGHETGDFVLVAIAGILVKNIHGAEVACRMGGEEFIIVMPGASLQTACARAEALRIAIAQSDIEHLHLPLGPITMSLGVSVFPNNGSDAESLLRSADQALYQAKRTGRNQTVTMSELPENA